MALISCPACHSDNDIHLDSITAAGVKIFRCGDCDNTWSPTSLTTLPAFTRTPLEMARGRFANAEMVAPAMTATVKRLKTKYLKAHPVAEDVQVTAWGRYRELLTPQGLVAAAPQDLRELATTGTGTRAGSMSVFSRTWKQLGDEEAADKHAHLPHLPPPRPRRAAARGPPHRAHRGRRRRRDARAQGVVPHQGAPHLEPHRFLPILTYGDEGTGKHDIARAVYGLHLPKPDPTAMQIGRLAIWSNDLLLELAGPDFTDAQHASEFLDWAKDRVGETSLASVR